MSARGARRLRSCAALAALTASVALLVPSVPPASAAGAIRPPVIAQDRPDPELVQDGSQWFAYSTNLFWDGINVPVMRSTTLDTWTNVGDALPSVGSWASEGFTWAPGVVKLGSTWVMYYTAMHSASQRQCIGRATAATAAGPFVDGASGPLVCQLDRGGSIDADPYVDADGTVWLVWKSDDNAVGQPTTLWMQSLAADGLTLVGSPQPLLTASEPWQQGIIENPSLAQVNGKLWLFYSGGWWDSTDYAMGYATCPARMTTCSNQSASPWMSHGSSGVPGVGGGTVLTRAGFAPLLAFHGWYGATSYGGGGVRSTYIEPLDFSPAVPTWRPELPRNLSASSLPSPRIPGDSPIGRVDGLRRVPGGLNVYGWALDPDLRDPIDVHVYVGSTGVAARAGQPRGDVAGVFPGYGAAHGFSVDVPATEGTYDVCAYAIDVGAGSNVLLQCQRVTVSSTPIGRLDGTRYVPGGLELHGWALDPDTGAPIQVHAYVGRSGVATTANVPRGDVGSAFPGYGADHGYAVVVPVAAEGEQGLCTYGINVGAGGLAAFGCSVVEVRASPWGALDGVQRTPDGVRVWGWAVDPSTAAPLDVHVYVGSSGRALRADQPRGDLLGHFPGWGEHHGYDATLPAGSAPVDVCAYAINHGPGGNVLIGCRRV